LEQERNAITFETFGTGFFIEVITLTHRFDALDGIIFIAGSTARLPGRIKKLRTSFPDMRKPNEKRLLKIIEPVCN
jgi:hypothetical protein